MLNNNYNVYYQKFYIFKNIINIIDLFNKHLILLLMHFIKRFDGDLHIYVTSHGLFLYYTSPDSVTTI